MHKSLFPLLLAAIVTACSDMPSDAGPGTTLLPASGHPRHLESTPCGVSAMNWTGPHFVTAGQYTYSISPDINAPAPGQTCPLNPEAFWSIERNSVETSLSCGHGLSCVITVNAGDASFSVDVRYRYTILENGISADHVVFDSYAVVVDATPFSAYVSGPQYLYPNTVCTWTAGQQGGVPPYTYSWSGALSGTSSSVTGGIARSSNLFLTVQDSQGRVASAQYGVEILNSYPTDCSSRGY